MGDSAQPEQADERGRLLVALEPEAQVVHATGLQAQPVPVEAAGDPEAGRGRGGQEVAPGQGRREGGADTLGGGLPGNLWR